MGGKAFDKLWDILPTPVAVAAVLIVILGLLRKLYKGKDWDYSNLFKDKLFKRGTGGILVVLGLFYMGYFGVVWIDSTRLDVEFGVKETGVYICPLKHDTNGMVADGIKAALVGRLKKEFKGLAVFKSRLKSPPEDTEIVDVGKKRNAAFVLTGMCIKESKYKLRIINVRSGKDLYTEWLKLSDDDRLVKLLEKVLSAAQRNHGPTGPDSAFSDTLDTLSTLQYRYETLNQRIKRLEDGFKRENATASAPLPEWNRWAVLIGINMYPDRMLHDLKYSVTDVLAMERQLLKAGYKKEHIIGPLVNDEATKEKIKKALDDLNGRLKPEDSVLVFYSGHSQRYRNGSGKLMGILCPHDYRYDSPETNGVTSSQLKTWLDGLVSREVTFVADSCFSGSFGSEVLNRGFKTNISVFKPRKERKKLDLTPTLLVTRAKGRKNRIILTAGRDVDKVIEGRQWGHGLLTFHVLEGLRGEGDLNSDGRLMADELFYYLYPRVVADSEGYQTPQFFAWGTGACEVAAVGTAKGNVKRLTLKIKK